MAGYDGWSPCRHCGESMDDPWELTGLLDHEYERVLYPLSLIGPKAEMRPMFFHKDCISGFFEYLAESVVSMQVYKNASAKPYKTAPVVEDL